MPSVPSNFFSPSGFVLYGKNWTGDGRLCGANAGFIGRRDRRCFYRELIESSISGIGIRFYEVWLIGAFEPLALNAFRQTCSSTDERTQPFVDVTQETSSVSGGQSSTYGRLYRLHWTRLTLTLAVHLERRRKRNERRGKDVVNFRIGLSSSTLMDVRQFGSRVNHRFKSKTCLLIG